MPVVKLVKSNLFVFSHISINKKNGLGLSVFAYMHKHMHFPYHSKILV